GDKNLAEHFTEYDKLNRLRRYYVEGQDEQSVDYDSLGNITSKTGVGDYRYGDECAVGFGPHAVCETTSDSGAIIRYSYDANGNMTSDSSGRALEYTPFDKPSVITKGGHTTTFKYSPDRARFLRTDENSEGVTTTRYIGKVEKITHPGGTQTVKRYLPGNVLVSFERDSGGRKIGAAKRQYLYKDHLGSLDVITDASGTVLQTLSFDAWGLRRSTQDWSRLDLSDLFKFDHSFTTKGFTGHEMLDEVGLIHMNGRIYDPRLGRFLQADTIIQFPDNTQSYNRYSYVLNNPVRYTDPSGHFIPVIVGVIAAAAGAEAVTVGLLVGFSAFAQTIAQGGSFGQALLSGIISGVSAGAFTALGGVNFADTALGQVLGETVTEVLAYGAVGGITSVLQGGKFGHGFVSAGFGGVLGSAAGGPIGRVVGNQVAARVITAAVVGGTLSKLTGGKFANGAAYAAFAALVQSAASSSSTPRRDITAPTPGIDTDLAFDNTLSTDVSGGDSTITIEELGASVSYGEAQASFFRQRSCIATCIADQLGIHSAVGGGMLVLGSESLSKPFQMGNASSGTSIASKYLSRMFPQRLKRQIPTPRIGHLRSATPVVGRAMGRYVSVVGTAITVYDAAKIGMCIQSNCSE
ncbi:MAG: RHS repeat-associated core domain-containing protein, partial [Exilibacterium sp.]